MSVNNNLGGEPCGQFEPLVVRLKGIIRDYPEGVGIIKELIQNADDAKATKVEITFDWRTHQPKKLPSESMKELMGPAMLFYNNQVFTDEDFDSINQIGNSTKVQDLQKTGRFGIGFNAVYHVTDYPSFISRNHIVFFDPHGSAVPNTSKQLTGYRWNLQKDAWWEKYPDLMNVYQAGGLPFKEKDFRGTLFRLPLRTEAQAEKSKIRNQAFTKENVKKLLDKLILSGEEILIFLKSVQEIHVYEISENSDGTRQEIFAILTKNGNEVEKARQQLLNVIPNSKDELLKACRDNAQPIALVSYHHKIETINRGVTQKESTWRVVSTIASGTEGELADVIEQLHQQEEKALPWAGAAARIATTEKNSKPIEGKAYCFLPTPIETGLPIHINGFFNLNSSRDNLTTDSGQTGRDEPKPLWNKLLVRHVLSNACATLIADLVNDIGHDNPNEYYKLWCVTTNRKEFEELPSRFIELLYEKKVLCSAVEDWGLEIYNGKKIIRQTNWVTPGKIKLLPDRNWWTKLVQPLSADRIDIPNPLLPNTIVNAFKKAGYPLKTFTPENLRLHLHMDEALGVDIEKAPKASLRDRQWIINMLGYCISDEEKDLYGLPLAILADNTLQVFGNNHIGTIYIANEKIREIFANRPKWFLHQDVVSKIPELKNCKWVSQMNATQVAEKLVDIIGSTEAVIHWEPNAENPPNATWLANVYAYFTKQSQLPTEELQNVPLVPGDDGRLYKGGDIDTPLLPNLEISDETNSALKYFGVHLIEAPDNLWNAIDRFITTHADELISYLTAPDALDNIAVKQNLPKYQKKHYNSLLNFLSQPIWLQGKNSYNQEQQNNLRQLPIYRTTSNELVNLNREDIYIPDGRYEAPEVAGSLKLLRLGGKQQQWLPLFRMLEVPVLNRARLIRDCLLKDYDSFEKEQQLNALTWIRDNLNDARRELQEEGQDFKTLKQEIQQAPLVLCADGELMPASQIYNPESEVVRNILGDTAAFPDTEFYNQNLADWLRFFKNLGMQDSPSADDLLGYVDNLIYNSQNGDLDTVTDSCLDVFNYVVEHWEELKEAQISSENITLPEALKNRAWLPVERNLEKLNQYPEAIKPEQKLYRAEEISFIQDAHLIASQKPLFNSNSSLPNKEILNALGFIHPVKLQDVVEHFKILIKFIEFAETNVDASTKLKSSFKEIYEFLYHRIDRINQKKCKQDFEIRPCLWDEKSQSFWKPKHAFEDNVDFFGNRRITINNLPRHTGEVYELLGQRRSPKVEDYLEFLEELGKEYDNTPLNEEDKTCVLQVLERLQSQFALENFCEDNILVLTEKNTLRPANEVLIPDAPWRKDYIKSQRILHPKVSPSLAQSVGSLSLLRDVIEYPINNKIITSSDTNFKEYCEKWEKTLNSKEFHLGFKRLIFHEYDIEVGTIFENYTVLPATEIKVNLFLENETKIASGVPGDYYFDKKQSKYYVRCSNSRDTMVGYLAQSFNNQFDQYPLSNLLPLARIIDENPENIMLLLDELRIRTLPGDKGVRSSYKPKEDEKSKPETDTTPVQVKPDIPDRTKTDISTSENSKELGKFGEEWAEKFYKWLGYTRVEKQEDWIGFDFLCNEDGKPGIKAEVKAKYSGLPNIRITQNEWKKMVEYEESYELLIVSHENKNLKEIIQISKLWKTLKYAFSQINHRNPTKISQQRNEAEVLIGFNLNSDGQRNDIIVNWHRLIESLPYENIKRYRLKSAEPIEFEVIE